MTTWAEWRALTPERLAHLLGGAKEESDGWYAFCPGHDDWASAHPNLHINEGRNGGVVFHCMTKCRGDQKKVMDAMEAVGIKPKWVPGSRNSDPGPPEPPLPNRVLELQKGLLGSVGTNGRRYATFAKTDRLLHRGERNRIVHVQMDTAGGPTDQILWPTDCDLALAYTGLFNDGHLVLRRCLASGYHRASKRDAAGTLAEVIRFMEVAIYSIDDTGRWPGGAEYGLPQDIRYVAWDWDRYVIAKP